MTLRRWLARLIFALLWVAVVLIIYGLVLLETGHLR